VHVSYRELSGAIGAHAADVLIDSFGGTVIGTSPRGRYAKRIEQLIGKGPASRLFFTFRGDVIGLPNMKTRQIQKRNEAMRADAKAGLSRTEIALKYKMTARNSRRILNAA